jgi:hypothetical protein
MDLADSGSIDSTEESATYNQDIARRVGDPGVGKDL